MAMHTRLYRDAKSTYHAVHLHVSQTFDTTLVMMLESIELTVLEIRRANQIDTGEIAKNKRVDHSTRVVLVFVLIITVAAVATSSSTSCVVLFVDVISLTFCMCTPE